MSEHLLNAFEEIIESSNQDITQENANTDGKSPMGIMNLIASESSKEYAINKILSKDVREAYLEGYIHPHDLDYFATGTSTCLSQDTRITIKDRSGNVKDVTIDHFDDLMEDDRVDIEGYHILSRDGWTKINNVVRRKKKKGEKMYKLITKKSLPLKATEDHKIPVIRDGEEKLLEAKEIEKNDKLIRPSYKYTKKDNVINVPDVLRDENVIIKNILGLRRYLTYKYGITDLHKFLGGGVSGRGRKYITIEDYHSINEKYYIPDEVRVQLEVSILGSKKTLPMNLPVTPELARFLGYLHSDGSVYVSPTPGSYHTTITNINNRINKDVDHVVQTAFNTGTTVRMSEGVEYGRLVSGKIYCQFIKAMKIKTDSFDMRIPDFILFGDDEIKSNYIRALFDGDGYVGATEIGYSTVCEPFSRQLTILLQSLGIESTLYTTKNKGTIGRVNGVEFTRNGDTHSIRIITKDSLQKFSEIIGKLLKQEIDPDYSYTMNNYRVKPTKIAHIREIEYDDYVYDIETADHWFVANGILVHNCNQIPLDKVLKGGFGTGHGWMREPNSIMSAMALSSIVVQSSQNMQHGGQSLPNLDFDLAPYIRKTYEKNVELLQELKVEGNIESKAWELTDKDTYQACEAFIHNANSMHSRGGNQVAFVSVNYGLDTSKEGRMLIKNMLLATQAGLGNGETPIFPIQVFKVKEGVNNLKGDPNYDLFQLALETTAKRLFPNYLMVDAPFNLQYYKEDEPRTHIATMGGLPPM